MTPNIIFIVPYRDRKEHKQFFTKYMEFIMEDYKREQYEIFFIHQCDTKPFNRGAMKNIGFLAMKDKYPEHYENITFVFNDIDTIPYTKQLLNYETDINIIKHFYGYKFALGGIFSIKGCDFEKINGFPNMWGWSMEDNMLQKRAVNSNIVIDRSNFYPIGSTSILQFVDAIRKQINKKEVSNFLENKYPYGLNSIHYVKYNIDNEYVNVTNFLTESNPDTQTYEIYDITKGDGKIRVGKKNNMNNNNVKNNNVKNNNVKNNNVKNNNVRNFKMRL
jgi:hypothetical protein